MHTDTSDIVGRGRPGRSNKPMGRWAMVALVGVAVVVLVSAFLLFSPYMSEEALVDRVVPPPGVEEPASVEAVVPVEEADPNDEVTPFEELRAETQLFEDSAAAE